MEYVILALVVMILIGYYTVMYKIISWGIEDNEPEECKCHNNNCSSLDKARKSIRNMYEGE